MKPEIPTRPTVDFTDPQLQQCYASNFAAAGDLSDKLRQVRALIAAHDSFEMLEGAHSARVHETIERLLSPRLRSPLRRWYQRADADKDSGAVAFRNHLSQLAGEKLEHPTDIFQNPS